MSMERLLSTSLHIISGSKEDIVNWLDYFEIKIKKRKKMRKKLLKRSSKY